MPEETATVTVSLKTNTGIKTNDKLITLTGLCGTVVNADSIALLDMFGSTLNTYSSPSTKNIAATADWDLTKKELKFKLGSVGLDAETLYVFKFQVKLMDKANDACPVTIAATGFAAATMTGSAGKVDAPAFVTAKIGQTSTRPDSLNFICVTLETNKVFNSASDGKQEQSRFTLTGLTGSQHKDEQGVPVYECPSNSLAAGSNEFGLSTKDGWAMPISTKAVVQLSGANAPFRPDTASRTAGTFDFTAATGTAVFVMDSTGFAKDTEYVFAILMTNSKTASDCKTVTMTTTGDIEQTAVLSAPTYARALIDGEADGDACPLKVYEPGFLTKIVSSSTKLSGAAATMTVTLRTNVDLKSSTSSFKASITLSGLTGTKTDDSSTLRDVLTSAGTGNVATAFSPEFDQVKWTKSTGVLVLELKAGSSCTHPTGSAAKSSSVTWSSRRGRRA